MKKEAQELESRVEMKEVLREEDRNGGKVDGELRAANLSKKRLSEIGKLGAAAAAAVRARKAKEALLVNDDSIDYYRDLLPQIMLEFGALKKEYGKSPTMLEAFEAAEKKAAAKKKRATLAPSIENQQLMPHEHRFGNHGTETVQFDQGDVK